jgi:hypothetical protein
MKYTLIISALILTLAGGFMGCGNNREKIDKPDDLIPRDTLVDVLVGIHKIDGAIISNAVDMQEYNKLELYNSLFAKYNMDEDRFNRTIRYYTVNDVEQLHEIYDEVLAQLSEEKAGLTQKLKE